MDQCQKVSMDSKSMSVMNKIRKETKGLFQCCWINHEDTAVDSGLEDDWKCIIQVNI